MGKKGLKQKVLKDGKHHQNRLVKYTKKKRKSSLNSLEREKFKEKYQRNFKHDM